MNAKEFTNNLNKAIQRLAFTYIKIMRGRL